MSINKKAQAGINGKVASLIGGLILLVMIGAVAPTIFTDLNATGGPTWLNTVLPIVAAAGIVFLAWRSFQR